MTLNSVSIIPMGIYVYHSPRACDRERCSEPDHWTPRTWLAFAGDASARPGVWLARPWSAPVRIDGGREPLRSCVAPVSSRADSSTRLGTVGGGRTRFRQLRTCDGKEECWCRARHPLTMASVSSTVYLVIAGDRVLPVCASRGTHGTAKVEGCGPRTCGDDLLSTQRGAKAWRAPSSWLARARAATWTTELPVGRMPEVGTQPPAKGRLTRRASLAVMARVLH